MIARALKKSVFRVREEAVGECGWRSVKRTKKKKPNSFDGSQKKRKKFNGKCKKVILQKWLSLLITVNREKKNFFFFLFRAISFYGSFLLHFLFLSFGFFPLPLLPSLPPSLLPPSSAPLSFAFSSLGTLIRRFLSSLNHLFLRPKEFLMKSIPETFSSGFGQNRFFVCFLQIDQA